MSNWGVNQKAAQKRQRQANKKKQDQQKREQNKQKQKWKDQFTEKKIQTAQQKQEKRLQELARKRQLKQLAEREAAQIQKTKKKQKGQFNQKKVTQAQLLQRQQQQLLLQQQRNNRGQEIQEFPQQNVNRNFQQYQVANTVEKALNILDDSQQRHPQRRYKAAFEAFCDKREAQIRLEYPQLKRSQRQQILRKQFQKHPQNPYNKKNVIAYNYNAKKQQEQDKK